MCLTKYFAPGNSPELKNLDDQKQNSHRPCRHYCASSQFALICVDLSESTRKRGGDAIHKSISQLGSNDSNDAGIVVLHNGRRP